jgi:multicomponent Na+:H+ antiporter subunit D
VTGGEADLLTRVSDDLPALQIAVPLLSAAVCLIIRRALAAWSVAMVVAWGSFASACVLLTRVLHSGPISYAEGGWRPPWGIELRIDLLNALVLLVVTGICAIVLTASPRSLDQEVWREHHHKFYALYLLCMTGLAGMTITGDVFNIFVFLEISSLSSYGLIAQGTTRRALTSAFQYLVMGTIGGTFILLGIGMLYMTTGTLNIADMAVQLAAVGPNRTVLVALACIGIGTGIKLAVFPLHIWLPNAYTYAPAIVTAFLAATATKVAYYVLVRFIFSVFGVDLAFGLRLDAVLMPLAIAAMFVGSFVAIFQDDLKRMLAYSSVAQIGYMVLGLSLASVSGLTGGLVHLFNHAIMKSGLFLVMAAVLLRVGSTRIEAFAGLGRRMPLTMAAFVAGGLSLIGVPLTVGFVSKWYLVLGALEGGLWPVAVLILLSSLLAVIYIWRVVEVAYFRPAPEDAPEISEAPISLLAPTWVLVGATIFFGVFTSLSVGVASAAARMLLGVEL